MLSRKVWWVIGTRADFYVRKGKDAKWMGSIGFDGYPDGIEPQKCRFKKGEHLLESKTEDEFLQRLALFFDKRNDVTRVPQGWPWPWETSHTTDYAYVFDKDHVDIYNFGSGPVFYHNYMDHYNEYLRRNRLSEEELKVLPEQPELFANTKAEFPDMTHIQNLTFGQRSGAIVVTSKGILQDKEEVEQQEEQQDQQVTDQKQIIKELIQTAEMSIGIIRAEIKSHKDSLDPKRLEYVPSLESAIAVIQLNIIKAKGAL